MLNESENNFELMLYNNLGQELKKKREFFYIHFRH